MKEIARVNEVLKGYNQAVRLISGNGHINAPNVQPFGKLWNRCALVYNECAKAGMTPFQYFLLAQGKYSLDWVRETFKRDYIPLPLAVSAKVTDWVLTSKATVTKPEEKGAREETFRKILKDYPAEVIEEVLARVNE